jgi:hypothetical protein
MILLKISQEKGTWNIVTILGSRRALLALSRDIIGNIASKMNEYRQKDVSKGTLQFNLNGMVNSDVLEEECEGCLQEKL